MTAAKRQEFCVYCQRVEPGGTRGHGAQIDPRGEGHKSHPTSAAGVRRAGEEIRAALGVHVEPDALRVSGSIDKELRAKALVALVGLERLAYLAVAKRANS